MLSNNNFDFSKELGAPRAPVVYSIVVNFGFRLLVHVTRTYPVSRTEAAIGLYTVPLVKTIPDDGIMETQTSHIQTRYDDDSIPLATPTTCNHRIGGRVRLHLNLPTSRLGAAVAAN